jgi:hypothetical protein
VISEDHEHTEDRNQFSMGNAKKHLRGVIRHLDKTRDGHNGYLLQRRDREMTFKRDVGRDWGGRITQ